MDKYILDEKNNPVKIDDVFEWAQWYEDRRGVGRVVRRTLFPDQKAVLSTVFLGIDHAFHGGRPILYETMLFENDMSGSDMRRYSTREEAEQGHMEMLDAYIVQQASQLGKRIKAIEDNAGKWIDPPH